MKISAEASGLVQTSEKLICLRCAKPNAIHIGHAVECAKYIEEVLRTAGW